MEEKNKENPLDDIDNDFEILKNVQVCNLTESKDDKKSKKDNDDD